MEAKDGLCTADFFIGSYHLRKKESIRVRQPLTKILVAGIGRSISSNQVEGVRDLILSEVNVKEIEYVTDTTGIIKKGIKPNFKTLGRRLGKNMKEGAAVINNFSQEDIAEIEKTGNYQLSLNGETYELTLEDFEIKTEDIPGWLVANDGPLTVALDVTITDELLAEGTARELVNRIQNIRKNKEFNVTDKIVVTLQNHKAITSAVETFGDYICNETLAVDLKLAENVTGETIDLSDEVSLEIQVELNR